MLPELELLELLLELLELELLELELLSALELLELELLPGLLELGASVPPQAVSNETDMTAANATQSHLDVPPVFGLKIQTETNP